ncbi:hypothetical protein ACIRG4_16650 [Streptomyces sp. NPDC102395]|uniref:hypothetical protein n=1 Tax=Streptomyces sp. NPDC102395 TaxID=3366168 RepID=UPI00381E79C9
MTPLLGPNRKHDVVLVLRDSDLIADTLRKALADASPEDRPGLERAAALVESTAATSEPRLRAQWVRTRLAAAGFTGPLDSTAAVKALRRVEPTLTLLAAAQLHRDAVAHPE